MLFFRLSFLKQVKLELIWKHILASAFLLEKQNHQLQIGPKKKQTNYFKSLKKNKKGQETKKQQQNQKKFLWFPKIFLFERFLEQILEQTFYKSWNRNYPNIFCPNVRKTITLSKKKQKK